MKLKPWTPQVLKNHYDEILTQNVGFGDESDGALRKINYKSMKDFQCHQVKYRDAIYRLATNPAMEDAWNWLITNDTHITAVYHVRFLTLRLLEDWRTTANKNNSERKATYKRIKKLAENLSKELVTIEFEKDTPLNEINVYLMGHRWFDDQPNTRNNIHSVDCQNSVRKGSLIAIAQNLPSLSVLVDRIGRAADEAALTDKNINRNVPKKMVDKNAFRTYTARYVDRELKKIWEDVPSAVALAVTQAISNDETLDISHYNKLIKSS